MTAPGTGSRITATVVAGVRIVVARVLGGSDDAEDAVQEILARAIEADRRGRVPPEVPFGAFVHGIARHVTADVLRQRKRHPLPLPFHVFDARPSLLDVLVRREDVARARRALATLDPADRELLVRYFLRGERIVDIARATDEPAERLRKRKSRALARLRATLDGHEPACGPTLES